MPWITKQRLPVMVMYTDCLSGWSLYLDSTVLDFLPRNITLQFRAATLPFIAALDLSLDL